MASMAEAKQCYQFDRERVLRNPHLLGLGLEIKIAEQEQGVIYNSDEGVVSVTSSQGQPKSFQLVLSNTRESDMEEEKEEEKPSQIGFVLHHCFVLEEVGVEGCSLIELSDAYSITNNPASKKIRIRSGKKYIVNVKAVGPPGTLHKVPIMIAFSHDTASPKAEATNRAEMSYMALELLIKKKKKTPNQNGTEEKVAGETSKKVVELQRKEKEMEELRQSIQKVLNDKSHEMSLLITSASQIEDSQIQRERNIRKIDAEIERLNIGKREIVLENEASTEDLKKIEKKKKKLELYLDSFTAETNARIQKLLEEIDFLQEVNRDTECTKPALPDSETRASPEFLQFLERQIQDLEDELECPVCLEIASEAPIFKCEEDHLICSKCREKFVRCPVCRVKYPRGTCKRLRGAERQSERLAGLNKEREAILQSQ